MLEGFVEPLPHQLLVQSQDFLNRCKVKAAAEFVGLMVGGSPYELYQVLWFA